MYGSNRIDNRNFRSLIIAGIGTIGSGLVTLGADQFSLFEHIYAIDIDPESLQSLQKSGIECSTGNIADVRFLNDFMADVPCMYKRAVGLNLNVTIRD